MIAGCRRIFAQRRTRAPGARRKLIGAHRGALGSLKRRLSGTEDPEGARVAVKKGLALNRPDLAVAEEPGERHLAQMPMKRVAVVIRLAIQMAPAAEAREEQCSRRRLLPVEVGAIAPPASASRKLSWRRRAVRAVADGQGSGYRAAFLRAAFLPRVFLVAAFLRDAFLVTFFLRLAMT